jgi:hypothetical protein
MKIAIDGAEVPLQVVNEERLTSRHTGRELRKFEAEVSIEGDDLEGKAEEAFTGLLQLSEDDGQDLGLWIVREVSSSYQSGVPIYHHTLEFKEREELEPELLVIGEFELEPYFYEERVDDDAIVITARAKMTVEQQDAILCLDEESEYFPVVRVGLSSTPLVMRLGRCIWSRADYGIKQEIVLVERCYDDHQMSWVRLHDLESRHAQDYLVRFGQVVNSVVEALVENGALRREQLDSVRDDLSELGSLSARDFWRVDDLDTLSRDE